VAAVSKGQSRSGRGTSAERVTPKKRKVVPTTGSPLKRKLAAILAADVAGLAEIQKEV
jgi:class 3 adenylate cyclase